MSKPERKVPLHLRERAKRADAITASLQQGQQPPQPARRDILQENLTRVTQQVAQGSVDPPPPPVVVMQDSRPVLIPSRPEAPAAPAATAVLDDPNLDPGGDQFLDPQAPAGSVQQDEVFSQLEAENAQLRRDLSMARQRQGHNERIANELRGQLAAEQEARASIEARLATLEGERELATAGTIDEATLAAYFTPEQRRVMGDDQCRAIITISRREAAQVARREVTSRVQPLETQIRQSGTTAAQSRKLSIFSALDNNPDVKDWRQLEASPDFEAWLLETEPMSQKTYREVLHAAFRLPSIEQAAHGCAAVYRAFKLSHAKPTAPRPKTAIPPSRQPAAVQTQVSPEFLTVKRMQELTQEFKASRDPKRRAEIQEILDRHRKAGTISR